MSNPSLSPMDKHAHAEHHVVSQSLTHKPGFELLQSCVTPFFVFYKANKFTPVYIPDMRVTLKHHLYL